MKHRDGKNDDRTVKATTAGEMIGLVNLHFIPRYAIKIRQTINK